MRLDGGARPITSTTRLVGIIGNPVSHSLSPRMHNAAFAQLELDWAYLPLPVGDERVAQAVAGLSALGFVGANVTIPHKQAVLEHCDVIEPSAARSGSANTLIVTEEETVAASTDGEGVARGVNPSGAHCLILGAGGASRPVIVALADAGARTITIAARRAEAATDLAAELAHACPTCELEAEADWPPSAEADIVVNATPIKDDRIVAIESRHQVVDLAYRSDGAPTGLIGAAHAAGCEYVVDGLEFLVSQGALSFERWTGLEAPVAVMRAAVRGDVEG